MTLRTHSVKIETVAYDNASIYYKYLGKLIKSLKHKVSKTTQQKLYVRHHFKTAFFAEMIKDLQTANKYYTSSYNYLKQIQCNENGIFCMELKEMAEILNYKIVRLLFLLSRSEEASTQFRSHLRKFKKLVGPEKLLFVHHNWMATQYKYFAELIENGPRKSYDRQFNSGYFYQTAAVYSVLQKMRQRLS